MKPSHVSEDGSQCMSCGGMVDAEGLAPLGEAEQFEGQEPAATDQHTAAVRMRDASGFADAVKMAQGGMVKEDLTDEEKAAMKRPDFNDETMKTRDAKSEEYYAEMKRKKAARYSPTGASR